MRSEFKTDYDFEEDLLYFYNESKKSSGSIEFGDLIVDLAKNGAIVGLEIFGASKYLSELTGKKIAKEALKEIRKANLSIIDKTGTIIIKIFLLLEKEQLPAAIAIQNARYKSPILAHAH